MSYVEARNNVNFVISLASLAWSCTCQFVFLCLSAYWVLSFIYLKKVSCLSLLGVFFCHSDVKKSACNLANILKDSGKTMFFS